MYLDIIETDLRENCDEVKHVGGLWRLLTGDHNQLRC